MVALLDGTEWYGAEGRATARGRPFSVMAGLLNVDNGLVAYIVAVGPASLPLDVIFARLHYEGGDLVEFDARVDFVSPFVPLQHVRFLEGHRKLVKVDRAVADLVRNLPYLHPHFAVG